LRVVALGVCVLLLAGAPGAAEAGADEADTNGDESLVGCPVDASERVERVGDERRSTHDAECTGLIQPGALMTQPSFCTLGFVFSDGSDYYVGTAAHCVSQGDRVGAEDVGVFGTVVMDDDSAGADVALVQVDETSEQLVEPTMCAFGGPTGVAEDNYPAGLPVYEYGWGQATNVDSASRERVHSNLAQSDMRASWNGIGSGGDSGAPVLTDDGEAYAFHTSGITPVAGLVLENGPTIDHALDVMADNGFDMDLVQGDDFSRV